MKTAILILLGALASWGVASAKIRASLAVAGDSLEDRIATTAGRGRVAVRLHEKLLEELREAAVQAKALRSHYTALATHGGDGGDQDTVTDSTGNKFQRTLQRLQQLEKISMDRFRTENERHIQLKTRLRRLDDQLTLLRAISTGIKSVKKLSSTNVGEMGSVTESLELEVHRAEADLELALEAMEVGL